MIDIIAEFFRFLVGLACALLFVGSIVAGGAMLVTGAGDPVIAVAVMIGGPLLTTLTFGALAIMIQNNALLRQIAGRDQVGGQRGRT